MKKKSKKNSNINQTSFRLFFLGDLQHGKLDVSHVLAVRDFFGPRRRRARGSLLFLRCFPFLLVTGSPRAICPLGVVALVVPGRSCSGGFEVPLRPKVEYFLLQPFPQGFDGVSLDILLAFTPVVVAAAAAATAATARTPL